MENTNGPTHKSGIPRPVAFSKPVVDLDLAAPTVTKPPAAVSKDKRNKRKSGLAASARKSIKGMKDRRQPLARFNLNAPSANRTELHPAEPDDEDNEVATNSTAVPVNFTESGPAIPCHLERQKGRVTGVRGRTSQVKKGVLIKGVVEAEHTVSAVSAISGDQQVTTDGGGSAEVAASVALSEELLMRNVARKTRSHALATATSRPSAQNGHKDPNAVAAANVRTTRMTNAKETGTAAPATGNQTMQLLQTELCNAQKRISELEEDVRNKDLSVDNFKDENLRLTNQVNSYRNQLNALKLSLLHSGIDPVSLQVVSSDRLKVEEKRNELMATTTAMLDLLQTSTKQSVDLLRDLNMLDSDDKKTDNEVLSQQLPGE